MELVITNPNSGSDPVNVNGFDIKVAFGTPSSPIEISASDLSRYPGLMKQVADGDLTIATTPSADELASGMLAPANSVQTADLVDLAVTAAKLAANSVTQAKVADDAIGAAELAGSSVVPDSIAAVAAATPPQIEDTLYFDIPTGGAADVELYAVNSIPASLGPKFRVLDAVLYVSGTPGASTVDIWTRAGGAGTLLANFDSTAVGRKEATGINATPLVTLGALEGLFALRSVNTVVCQLVLRVRRES